MVGIVLVVLDVLSRMVVVFLVIGIVVLVLIRVLLWFRFFVVFISFWFLVTDHYLILVRLILHDLFLVAFLLGNLFLMSYSWFYNFLWLSGAVF